MNTTKAQVSKIQADLIIRAIDTLTANLVHTDISELTYSDYERVMNRLRLFNITDFKDFDFKD